jgi:diguanylate cyclase (GGDEF)-like protein
MNTNINFSIEYDYLTNLPNRIGLISKLKRILSKNQDGAVILLDLDNYKFINNTFGHSHGDLILKEIADRIINITDDALTLFRFGGDEFLILIEYHDLESRVLCVIDKIYNIFHQPFKVNGIEKQIQFSMGIAAFPHDSIDFNQLIIFAETAMYKVKESGKNNHVFFSQSMHDELNGKLEIEYILKDALKNNGFKLVYQPQVDSETGTIVGYEALLRLKNHFMSPIQFIPIAEEFGMIKTIGRWVTKEAISQLRLWKNAGLEDRFISINFSSKQICDEGYIDFLNETLHDFDVEPNLLEIEITESILIEEKYQSISFINRLKDSGVCIALDDFGTGYSSINYLTYLPLTKIKLDKSLIDKSFLNPESKLLENIITLIKNLNLKITAEGIENRLQLDYLKTCKCDLVQGYFFSRPKEVLEITENWNLTYLI